MVNGGVALEGRACWFRLWDERDQRDGFEMNGRGDEEVIATAQTVVAGRLRLGTVTCQGAGELTDVGRAEHASKNLERREEQNDCGGGANGSTRRRHTAKIMPRFTDGSLKTKSRRLTSGSHQRKKR